MRTTLIILILALAQIVMPAQSIHEMLDRAAFMPSTQISLLTCDPGGEVYTMYGHSAVRVWNDSLDFDAVFNYGTYDFNTPGFLPKFIKGQLPYKLSVASMRGFVSSYRRDGRGITQNIFQLDSLAIKQFVDALNLNYRPENREYAYDFFFDNCATRIFDVLDASVDGAVTFDVEPEGYTYREMISMYQKEMPWTDFGIDLIIGSPADKKASMQGQMFLPDFLKQSLRDSRIDGAQLVGEDYQILASSPLVMGRSWLTPMILFVVLFLLEVLRWLRGIDTILWQWYDRLWWIVVGLAGTLLLFMWMGTDHLATHRNYHLLWLNPLYFLLLSSKVRQSHLLSTVLLVGVCLASLGVFGVLPQAMPITVLLLLLISASKLLSAVLTSANKVR